MSKDAELGALLRRYDPVDVSFARLEALETAVLRVALMTPQLAAEGAFDVEAPVSRGFIARCAVMAVMMLVLGMVTGQNLPLRTASAESHDFIAVALATPWQDMDSNP